MKNFKLNKEEKIVTLIALILISLFLIISFYVVYSENTEMLKMFSKSSSLNTEIEDDMYTLFNNMNVLSFVVSIFCVALIIMSVSLCAPLNKEAGKIVYLINIGVLITTCCTYFVCRISFHNTVPDEYYAINLLTSNINDVFVNLARLILIEVLTLFITTFAREFGLEYINKIKNPYQENVNKKNEEYDFNAINEAKKEIENETQKRYSSQEKVLQDNINEMKAQLRIKELEQEYLDLKSKLDK